MEEQTNIPIPRATLERLIVVLTTSYDRQPSREVKQATDTIKRLLEREKTIESPIANQMPAK